MGDLSELTTKILNNYNLSTGNRYFLLIEKNYMSMDYLLKRQENLRFLVLVASAFSQNFKMSLKSFSPSFLNLQMRMQCVKLTWLIWIRNRVQINSMKEKEGSTSAVHGGINEAKSNIFVMSRCFDANSFSLCHNLCISSKVNFCVFPRASSSFSNFLMFFCSRIRFL